MVIKKTKRERTEDLRLRRIYNITLEEKKAKLKNQNYCCAMCSKPFDNRRMFIDHNHVVAKAKINVCWVKCGNKKLWIASSIGYDYNYQSYNRKDAVSKVRACLKRLSVRGVLCFLCNQKILGRLERFKVPLQAIIDYLESYDSSNRLLIGGRWKPDTK